MDVDDGDELNVVCGSQLPSLDESVLHKLARSMGLSAEDYDALMCPLPSALSASPNVSMMSFLGGMDDDDMPMGDADMGDADMVGDERGGQRQRESLVE